MFQTFANAWKIPELRKKILFTALILLVFRIGSAIPVPFINVGENGIFDFANDATMQGTFMEYLTMMTGNAFNYGTIFAMSITPYINSSIIMQLLTVAIPPLRDLQKTVKRAEKRLLQLQDLLQSLLLFFRVLLITSISEVMTFCSAMLTAQPSQALQQCSRH